MRGRLCTCEMSYLDYCEGQGRRTVHSDVLAPPGGTLGSAAPPCPAGPALSAARPPSIGPAFSAARSKPGGTSEGLHNRGRTVAIQRRTSVYIGLLERRTLGPCKLFGTLRVCSGCRCVTTTNRSICMCPCHQLDPSVAEESGYDGGQSQGVELRRRTVAGVRCPLPAPGHTANAGDPQLCWVGASLPPYAWMPAKAISKSATCAHTTPPTSE